METLEYVSPPKKSNIWPATHNGGQRPARSSAFNWFSFVIEECAFTHSVAMELLIEQLPWALEEHWWTRLNFCSSQATLEWVPVQKEELFNTVKRVSLIVSGYRLNIDSDTVRRPPNPSLLGRVRLCIAGCSCATSPNEYFLLSNWDFCWCVSSQFGFLLRSLVSPH